MVAARRGERTALTGPEANALVHHERAEVDAIAIGSETVLVDDPLLTARGVYRDRPLVRVVFDRRLRTPPTARLFSTLDAGPVIVMSAAASRPGGPERVEALVAAGAHVELVEEVGADGSGEAASRRFSAPRWRGSRRRDDHVARRRGRPDASRCVLARGTRRSRRAVRLAAAPSARDGVEWAPMPDGSIASLAELTAQAGRGRRAD